MVDDWLSNLKRYGVIKLVHCVAAHAIVDIIVQFGTIVTDGHQQSSPMSDTGLGPP